MTANFSSSTDVTGFVTGFVTALNTKWSVFCIPVSHVKGNQSSLKTYLRYAV